VPHHAGSAMHETTRPVNGQTHPLGGGPVEADHRATPDRYATTALWPEALALVSVLLLVSLLLTGWVPEDLWPF
jgi:hypothetical protein